VDRVNAALENAICCRQDRRPPLRLVKIFLKSGSRSFGIHLESSYYPNFVAFRLNINSLLRSILGVYLRRSISGFTFCGTRCRLCLFRQSFFFHIRGVQGFYFMGIGGSGSTSHSCCLVAQILVYLPIIYAL